MQEKMDIQVPSKKLFAMEKINVIIVIKLNVSCLVPNCTRANGS